MESVVEKVWKDIGGNQEEMMSAEKFGRYKPEVEENYVNKNRKEGKAGAQKQGEIGETLRDIRGITVD